ncbi:F0F1 ATP synthase subunit delta [Candidatus Daviesbacteria bacterium]|nr:F0F1 ATP synthase subunit delta [Candidatus Daviesbacteria bacterium]
MKEKKKLKKIAAQSAKLSFDKGKLNKLTAEEVLKALKTLPKAQAIYAISKFIKGLKKRSAETSATIESVVPLSKKQLTDITGKLSKEFAITGVVNVLNPDILGGVKIKLSDTVLDYSLQGKISQIGKVFKA